MSGPGLDRIAKLSPWRQTEYLRANQVGERDWIVNKFTIVVAINN